MMSGAGPAIGRELKVTDLPPALASCECALSARGHLAQHHHLCPLQLAPQAQYHLCPLQFATPTDVFAFWAMETGCYPEQVADNSHHL